MSAVTESFDFFVSYARADNSSGWITRFIAELQEEQRRFTGGREFRVFFDTSDIRSLDDWRHRIYESLAASHLLVAFISPEYFASEWCRREWRTWIDVEIAKHILSDGAAPVYIVEVPWLASAMGEQQVAEAITRLSRRSADSALAQDAMAISGQVAQRQWTRVQPFYGMGLDALRREDLRKVLTDLARNLSDRSEHVRVAAGSRSTLPPYNRRFVGRLEELTLLRERLHQGRTGIISGHRGDLPTDKSVIASVHGLGGIGKTELAFTYAHAFAGLYPGGRFLVPCDGRSDLRFAMLALDEVFRSEISDEERKTLDLHFGAIRDGLRRRLDTMGRLLLVLDNVTDAALLSPEQTDQVRALGPDLHLLATTRLGAPEGGGAFDDVHWLTLGELGLEDSLRLLEKHRSFATPEEREAAEAIARRLGGFALCVEVVGAYLGQHLETGYAQFLASMGLSDLEQVDLAAERRDVITRRHNNEKRLYTILDHALRELPGEAMSTLHFASLLAPDHIVLPWLSKLAGDAHPLLAADAAAWRRLVTRLVSLALLTRGNAGEEQALDESHQPRVLRCHRLLQDYLREKSGAGEKAARQQAVDALVRERDAVLEQTSDWQEARWEVPPLTALAGVWEETHHPEASWLLHQVGRRWHLLFDWSQAEQLLRRALAIDEQNFGMEHPKVGAHLFNLAPIVQGTGRWMEAEQILRRALDIFENSPDVKDSIAAMVLSRLAGLLGDTNRLAEAEQLHRRALPILEKIYRPDHPIVARTLTKLASVLYDTNRLKEAETLYRRALAIDEKWNGRNSTLTASSLSNLALLLQNTNRPGEAEPLFRRALAIDEKCFGAGHPAAAKTLNNLAELLRVTNRPAEAEPLFRQALAIWQKNLGEEHTEVAGVLSNLGLLLQATGRFSEAEQALRRALSIVEKNFGLEHPDVARVLNNLALTLADMNRFAESALTMRRVLVLLSKFGVATGHEHPHLRDTMMCYHGILRQTGQTDTQARAQVHSALGEGGMRPGG